MPVNPTTYSFKDLTGVLSNPLLGTPIQLVGGNIGLGEITIRMLTERTDLLTGTDGVVMVTYVPGSSGEVTIQMQQTSQLHHDLLDLYNTLQAAADEGDVSNWAATVINLRTILDGSGHLLSGVGFQKITDKPYAARGQNVTWTFLAADVVQQ